MESSAETQTQLTPPAVVNLAVMEAGTEGILPLQLAGPAETCGVNPQVSLKAVSAKPSPGECMSKQLFEIVTEVARRFRTAKADVVEHKGYVLRLKAEVFKVSFGSVGVYVPVTYRIEEGVPATKKMRWNEFSKTQFGVSADWINRVCGGKEEDPGQTRKSRREKRNDRHAYEAEKAEMQSQPKVAGEKQAALTARLADLEKENEKLHGIAERIQEQLQKSGSKVVVTLQAQVEKLEEIAELAVKAFQIINGKLGERLMVSEEGRRLVDIAKRAVAMKGSHRIW